MRSNLLNAAMISAMTLFGSAVLAEETIVSPGKAGAALTIYGQNFAAIQEKRSAVLKKGARDLALEGLPSTIIVDSLKPSFSGPAEFHLQQMDFDVDVYAWSKLLQKHIGQDVEFTRGSSSAKNPIVEAGTLLAVDGTRAVISAKGQIFTVAANRLSFKSPAVPYRLRPTLLLSGRAAADGEAGIDLTYLANGIGWNATYVGALNEEETMLSLQSFANITNGTDSHFTMARLRVVSGYANRPAQRRPQVAPAAMMRAAEAADSAVQEASISDFHIFEIKQPVTLKPRQQKQVALFDKVTAPVQKEYIFEGFSQIYPRRYANLEKYPANVRLVLENSASSNLGRVLPGGVMRVYQGGHDYPVFLGESGLAHTAIGETVKLDIGQAFEIKAERKQTDFNRTGLPRNVYESAYEIRVTNGKIAPVKVDIIEQIPGDWEILSQSHPHEKPDSQRAQWKLDIPAGGATTLTYRVRVQN